MKDLEELTVEGINYDGLKYLEGLSSLSNLTILGDSSAKLSPVIGSLSGLKELAIFLRAPTASSFDGASIGVLADLPELRSLSIEGVDGIGVAQVSKLSHLESLSITIIERSNLDSLGNLQNLRNLSISIKSPVDQKWGFLKRMDHLSSLQIFCNESTIDFPFDQLKNLQHLSLHVRVSEDASDSISRIPQLKSFSARVYAGNSYGWVEVLQKRGVDTRLH
jgi:Leucine-rich repeat (LRR) protein